MAFHGILEIIGIKRFTVKRKGEHRLCSFPVKMRIEPEHSPKNLFGVATPKFSARGKVHIGEAG